MCHMYITFYDDSQAQRTSSANPSLLSQIRNYLLCKGRKRAPLWGPFYAWADQPVFHHPGIQECPDEFPQPLILDSFGDLSHQFVVIDSIEKFLQIQINHPAIACGNVLLRLGHRLMSRPSWSEPVAVIGKRRIPLSLENLHNRLLDEPVQHSWNAEFAHPSSVRLFDFHPPHGFRLVGPVPQLFPNDWPVLLQIAGEFLDGLPVNSRTTSVGLHLL